MTAPNAFNLSWKDKGERQTARGPRRLYEAAPTAEFSAAWKSDKDTLKDNGYGFFRSNDGDWLATYWARPTAEETAARAVSVVASRAAAADIDVPAPEGKAYLPYQLAGIAYAMARPAVLFGDEMGIGKTIQALGVVNASAARKVLVVCPASLKLNWSREAAAWLVAPLPIHVVRPGNKPFPIVGDAAVVIINYDILHKHHDAIRSVEWDVLVCDEAHALKSKGARRTKEVFGAAKSDKAPAIPPIRAARRILMTGTPISNRPVELHPLLAYLDPATWGNFMSYARRYCDATQTRYGWDFTGSSRLDELQERLRSSLMVRRLKADVLSELPAKLRQVVPLDVDGKALKALLAEQVAAFERQEAAVAEAKAAMRTAHVTQDAEAYEAAAAQLREAQGVAFSELSRLRREVGLAKVESVLEHMSTIDHPVVLFAYHREVVDALTQGLREAGKTVVHVTGDMDVRDRQVSVDAFQAGKADVIVGTMGAMSTGLTLTRASHVVFSELDWVPATLSQSEDRCHRIGQRDSVLVQHLVFDGSLDARMVHMVIEKQQVISAALDAEAEAKPVEEAPPVDAAALYEIELRATEAVAAKAAAEAARTEEERAEAVELAGALKAVRPWTLSPGRREEVAALLALDFIPPAEFGRARALVDGAKEAFDAAGRSVQASTVEARDMAKAADPEFRLLVHRHLREMTALDADHATEKNGIGWSATTTARGHWLSESETLTQHEAALGRQLLRKHYFQVEEMDRGPLFREGDLPSGDPI